MWIYTSELTMGAASVVSLLLLVWVITGRNPVREVLSAGRRLLQDPRILGALVASVTMLLISSAETRWFEPIAHRMVPWDYTQLVARGTGLIHLLQRLEWDPLTHALTFVYIIVFPLLMLSSLVVYSARNDWETLKRLLTGYWLNYLVALPFYIWFPVKEAWAGTAGIRFLIPVAYPAFEAEYRVYSALDNCFPSLHTSLALTYALIAWRSGYRRLAMVLTVAAGLVMFSTLYLGVHWVPDLFAGVALAMVASGWLPRLVFSPRAVTAQENR